MNCTDAEALFSDYIEGNLSAQDLELVAGHLEACGACHAGLEALRYALGDLHSLSLRETSADEVGSIMAAVDLAQARPAPAPWRPALTHLVAAGLGALMVWLFWPAEVRVEPQFVERVVEVEVPVERTVRVEVPVERVVEVPVERVVQVEVPVEVERIVRVAHPLQFRADLVSDFTRAFATLAELAIEPSRSLCLDPPAALVDDSAPVRVADYSPTRDSARSAVLVVRSGDRVSLRTRGSTEEVVPALIAMLPNEDQRLQRVIEEQLESIRGRPGVPGAFEAERDRSHRSSTALGGIKALINRSPADSDEAPIPSAPELWRNWWETRSTELAALDLRATY